MARKKQPIVEEIPAAPATDINITEILETNYMPYAMSVIISRAIPAIDGFKPSHRKLLYTMYKMGLLKGTTVKSAKIAGATMTYNPHGDASIYDTMVRLTTGKEALLHPFVESKGSFGRQYSDMPAAASRYTEAKLAKISEEIFSGIEKDAVDFVPNYDNTEVEPSILPTAFPNILVSPNTGIAVSLASNICSFNLNEICDAAIVLLKNGSVSTWELLDIIKAPDFSTGGYVVYNREQLAQIYETGRGRVKVRAKYNYVKESNLLEITEIPYTTTSEKIIASIVALVKEGKIKEISDVRDETDKSGLKIAIDLKRGADHEKLMARLFKSTPLEDGFACNFNILVGNIPQTMGIAEILDEWVAFRTECLRRSFSYDLGKKSDKLHLLYGLREILLDIDKAIKIVRGTEKDEDVVPNLMSGFNIDKVQAEYVADIKLRNLNKDYILKRIEEIEELEQEIARLEVLVGSDKLLHKEIIKQLTEIKRKYGMERKTQIIYDDEIDDDAIINEIEDYAVTVFLTRDGFFKKCLPSSLRLSSAHKLKDGDAIVQSFETSNAADLLVFTSKAQLYKAKLDAFDTHKASVLGEFLPAFLGFDDGEKVVCILVTSDYSGDMALFFENGKAVRLPINVYQTKTNRKKLSGAFFDKSPLIGAFSVAEGMEFVITSNASRALLVEESQLCAKSTRTSAGATIFTLRKGQFINGVTVYGAEGSLVFENDKKYRKKALPAAGVPYEEFKQQTLI
ncbi:MAG: topoisomerase IV [Clostridia bacterium]|nr:topoisomerase IV [Clostridia bacterium]